jgi:hemophore-related protein
MRHPTLVALAGGGLAAALALGAAVPALATSATLSATPSSAGTASSTASSTSGSATPDHSRLTGADLVTIDRFFESHPVLGNRLVARIDAWKTYLANHPNFAAKVAEWKALTPAERRAARKAWLADHPAIRHDLQQLRADRRELRRDLRELRHDLLAGSHAAAS